MTTTEILDSFIQGVVVNRTKYIVLNIFVIVLSFSIFFVQPVKYSTTTLIHSRVFPFETFSNILEPIIIAVKHERDEELALKTNLPLELVKSIQKVKLKKIDEAQDKIDFNGLLFYLTIETKEGNRDKNIEIVNSIVALCNNDRFTKNQLDILISNKEIRINNLNRAIKSLEKFDSTIMESTYKVNNYIDIGKMYESSGELYSQFESINVEVDRLRNGFQILSTSSPFQNVKLPFFLIYLLLFLLFNTIYLYVIYNKNN